MEQVVQSSGHSPELTELKDCLDAAFRHRVCFLGGAVWSQGLDLVILVGAFHLGTSRGSVNRVPLPCVQNFLGKNGAAKQRSAPPALLKLRRTAAERQGCSPEHKTPARLYFF